MSSWEDSEVLQSAESVQMGRGVLATLALHRIVRLHAEEITTHNVEATETYRRC